MSGSLRPRAGGHTAIWGSSSPLGAEHTAILGSFPPPRGGHTRTMASSSFLEIQIHSFPNNYCQRIWISNANNLFQDLYT
ncbi:unnamed protein product [Rotaria sp. Silwood1]|nr:unnamed protein product [Rotaria sp. Silwood1]